MKKYAVTLLNALAVFAGLLLLWQGWTCSCICPPICCPRLWPWAGQSSPVSPRWWPRWPSPPRRRQAAWQPVSLSGLIALLFAQSRWIRRMLYPYTILLQTVPIVAVAPLILMWVGPGTLSVTLVAFIICLAPIIANTTQGLISVEPNLIHLFLMHNASRLQILTRLRLPHAVPRSLWASALPPASP
jgi:NitT/TauT family transport system permease protein